MGVDITAQLSRFVTETKFEAVPEEITQFVKGLILKTVAGMVAGSVKPSGRKIAGLVREQKPTGQIGVFGNSFKTSLWEAVFLQAFFAHASELEDDSFTGGGVCWDITVIPLAFPLAESRKLSGRALLEAIIVGLEVHARTCQFPAGHMSLSVLPGAVGPAAAAARALKLDVNQTANALGLAMSGVPLAFANYGTDGHYFESALQSLQGVMAGEMAGRGMTSNPDIAGYLTDVLGKKRVIPEKLVADLGKMWLLREIWVKKYPCCFLNHRHIDALLDLTRAHRISPEDVALVEVHISQTEKLCDRPEPKNDTDMQFSYQHVLSAALLDGDVRLEHITDRALVDPRFKECRSRVKVILHPEWSRWPMAAPARIVIKTKDGKEYIKERAYAVGAPQEPLTMEQFRELYSKFTRNILPAPLIEKTADMILNLENLKDANELTSLLEFELRPLLRQPVSCTGEKNG